MLSGVAPDFKPFLRSTPSACLAYLVLPMTGMEAVR